MTYRILIDTNTPESPFAVFGGSDLDVCCGTSILALANGMFMKFTHIKLNARIRTHRINERTDRSVSSPLERFYYAIMDNSSLKGLPTRCPIEFVLITKLIRRLCRDIRPLKRRDDFLGGEFSAFFFGEELNDLGKRDL